MPPYPPRIRPRIPKRAKRKVAKVSQCDNCEAYGCTDRDRMARKELLAAVNDQPRPECGDRVPGFWERVNE